MNIMLVSVTERTREIGIRLAVGARKSDIRNQFLIEAILLSALGGIIGVFFGLFIGYEIVMSSELPFILNPGAILMAVSVAGLTGIIFGLYPAVRAADLDPIVALRAV
jgi:putative ABC transport system permease protein